MLASDVAWLLHGVAARFKHPCGHHTLSGMLCCSGTQSLNVVPFQIVCYSSQGSQVKTGSVFAEGVIFEPVGSQMRELVLLSVRGIFF